MTQITLTFSIAKYLPSDFNFSSFSFIISSESRDFEQEISYKTKNQISHKFTLPKKDAKYSIKVTKNNSLIGISDISIPSNIFQKREKNFTKICNINMTDSVKRVLFKNATSDLNLKIEINCALQYKEKEKDMKLNHSTSTNKKINNVKSLKDMKTSGTFSYKNILSNKKSGISTNNNSNIKKQYSNSKSNKNIKSPKIMKPKTSMFNYGNNEENKLNENKKEKKEVKDIIKKKDNEEIEDEEQSSDLIQQYEKPKKRHHPKTKKPPRKSKEDESDKKILEPINSVEENEFGELTDSRNITESKEDNEKYDIDIVEGTTSMGKYFNKNKKKKKERKSSDEEEDINEDEKYTKKGRKSIADLHSNLFEEYIKDDKNKIINYSTDIDNVIKKRINSKKILESIPAELINKEIENTDNKNNINKEKIINSKNIIKNNKERKSISCKNINKNINIKHKLSINIKPKRDIKILKFPCNDKERKILNSKARHKSLIIETKNNIINNKIIKSKILINKTNISYKNRKNCLRKIKTSIYSKT